MKYLVRKVNLKSKVSQKSSLNWRSFFKKILFIFRERGREGERERNINVWLPLMHPLLGTWLACNPGMCPDWEPNPWPFGWQASTQSTEPHQRGLKVILEENSLLSQEDLSHILLFLIFIYFCKVFPFSLQSYWMLFSVLDLQSY